MGWSSLIPKLSSSDFGPGVRVLLCINMGSELSLECSGLILGLFYFYDVRTFGIYFGNRNLLLSSSYT